MLLPWAQLIPLLGPANAGLARYDGLLSAIPNAHILLSPLTTQEAVLSSKIEGTHVTIGEVLEIEAGGESDAFTQPKRLDAEEVLASNIKDEASHQAEIEVPEEKESDVDVTEDAAVLDEFEVISIEGDEPVGVTIEASEFEEAHEEHDYASDNEDGEDA